MVILSRLHAKYRSLSEKQVQQGLQAIEMQNYASATVVDEHEDFEESTEDFDKRLMQVLSQMMFVSGEQAEPSAETTYLIEEIVREQVIEMVSLISCHCHLKTDPRQLKEATVLANRRGSKSISIVDLIFQIRHNTAKVSRLKTFLSWKDVRKNVKDSDDKGGGDADAIDLEDVSDPALHKP